MDIRRVFREGRRVEAGPLMLHARRRGADEKLPPGARVGIAAARRFPSAVARNRARRITREAARILLRESRDPWDLVLVVRPGVLERSVRERADCVADLLRRAGVISASTVAAP